jgi:hypothetical protein
MNALEPKREENCARPKKASIPMGNNPVVKMEDL